MVTPSPFAFLDDLARRASESLQPPAWLIDELQHRAVLFLNHVLGQEAQAQERLARQRGKVVRIEWRQFHMLLAATPAGLLERAPAHAVADLTLAVTDESPAALARAALAGEKPAVRISGDVQLAAEVNWLVDNVRWDVEDDLARVIGDAPAHSVAQAARGLAGALRGFVAKAGRATTPSAEAGERPE
ncbi:MAG: hypothetical protein KA795_13315 [Burkholderiaceae bacterium]|nr:hypothetical protein [Burkholderiaceae bacterium]